MSGLPGPLARKRKQLDSSSLHPLTEQERALYNVIRSKTDVGIWKHHFRQETRLPDTTVEKSLKSLQARNQIKEVQTVQNKPRKHYMAAEFEPSKEIRGGAWYVDGSLDTEFIDLLKDQCAKLIHKKRVATVEAVVDAIRRSGICNVKLTSQQIEEILRVLVLDNEIVELKSSGTGEFDSIPVGKVCYKCTSKRGEGEPRIGAMASIPCGVCPLISQCTPDSLISPRTCKYYSKWLNF